MLGTSEISLSTLRLRLRRINKIYSWQRRIFRQKRKSIKRMWKIIPKRDIFVSRFFVLDVLWRWKISRIFLRPEYSVCSKKSEDIFGVEIYTGKSFSFASSTKIYVISAKFINNFHSRRTNSEGNFASLYKAREESASEPYKLFFAQQFREKIKLNKLCQITPKMSNACVNSFC